MVQRCLRKATGRKHFTLEQLITLLTEIEAILNSRALTYVYEDFESGFTLTPSHFLMTNRKLGLPTVDDDYFRDSDYQPNRDSTTQLLESWKKGQQHLNLFWKVWQEEYLLSLREKLPIYHKGSKFKNVKVPKEGDIVLIKDDNMPRSSWKLGKIQRLKTGIDGVIRSAEILLPSHTVISRGINFLYPLELPTLQDENKNLNIIVNVKMIYGNKQELLLMILCILMKRERYL